MRILHINKTASSGGAGIATRRHCEAMRKIGIDSEMLSMRGKMIVLQQFILQKILPCGNILKSLFLKDL